jgi:hypothetical protein
MNKILYHTQKEFLTVRTSVAMLSNLCSSPFAVFMFSFVCVSSLQITFRSEAACITASYTSYFIIWRWKNLGPVPHRKNIAQVLTDYLQFHNCTVLIFLGPVSSFQCEQPQELTSSSWDNFYKASWMNWNIPLGKLFKPSQWCEKAT